MAGRVPPGRLMTPLTVTAAMVVVMLVPAASGVTSCPADLSADTLCEGSYKEGECPSGYLYKDNILGCSRCGGCVKYRGLDESCTAPEDMTESSRYTVRMVSGRAKITTDECSAGLVCSTTSGNCEVDDTQSTACQKKLHIYRTDGQDTKQYLYQPTCEPDGTFAAVQCQTRPGSFMFCFCVTEDGTRIDGRDLSTNKDAMNCACSRKVVELKAAGREDVTLHCMANGNYEPLQCDNDVCFCVNSTTAEPYGATVSRDMWKGLPCYDASYFPGAYERLCESMNMVASDVEKLMTAHGMEMSNMYQPCDFDGGYDAKICTAEDQMCRCRDKAGNAISPYVVDSSHDEANDMNCRCARDHHDTDPISTMLSTVSCDTTGNYDSEQCQGSACYCVDEWGERNSANIYTSTDVGDLARCCLHCLKQGTLDCTSDKAWQDECPEDYPIWT